MLIVKQHKLHQLYFSLSLMHELSVCNINKYIIIKIKENIIINNNISDNSNNHNNNNNNSTGPELLILQKAARDGGQERKCGIVISKAHPEVFFTSSTTVISQ